MPLTQVGKDPTVFKKAVYDNHYVRGLCSNPINAAILLHLLLIIQTGLPTTQTELFKCFILNLLLHRLEDKLPVCRKVQRFREFSDLPQNEKKVFNNLCLIAHHCWVIVTSQRTRSPGLMSGGIHSEGHIQTMSAAGVPSLGPGYRLALLHRGHQRRVAGYYGRKLYH